MMENKKQKKKALKNEKNEKCLSNKKKQDTIVYPDTMTQVCILTQF